jgi:hypothetical protein
MQPDKLARSFKGDLDGMYARVLFAWPPEPGYRPLTNEVAEIEPEIVNALTRIVGLLREKEAFDRNVGHKVERCQQAQRGEKGHGNKIRVIHDSRNSRPRAG